MAKKVTQEAHTPKPEHEVGVRVFVYGTLKRLHYNHYLIEDKDLTDNVFLGCCAIAGAYQMRDLLWYPGVQYIADAKAQNKIYGEVYRITPDTLKALDILEGNGSFFTRLQIETPWKKAWMYMIPSSFDSGRPIIKEGVWKPNAQEKDFIQSGETFWSADKYFSQVPKL